MEAPRWSRLARGFLMRVSGAGLQRGYAEGKGWGGGFGFNALDRKPLAIIYLKEQG